MTKPVYDSEEYAALHSRIGREFGHDMDKAIDRVMVLEDDLTTSRATCARLQERCSTLEDAAHHFWGCVTCAQDGENCCIEGRKFAAFLRGEAVNED